MARPDRPLVYALVIFTSLSAFASNAKVGWKKAIIESAVGTSPVPAGFITNAGGEVVATYPSYQVARFPDASLAPARTGAAAAGLLFITRDDFDEVFLPGRTFDARLEAPPTDYPAGTIGLYVLQFIAPPQRDWIQQVQVLGATLFQYIPQNAYLLIATPQVIPQLRNLPAVQWVGRVTAEMKNQHFSKTVGEHVDVLVDIAEVPDADTLVSRLRTQNIGDFVVYHELSRTRVRCNILSSDATNLLDDARVIGITNTPHDSLSDERQAMSLTANVTSNGAPINPTTYGAWLSQRCSYCSTLDAEGFIAGTADTGLDGGAGGAIHLDFGNRAHFGPTYGPGDATTHDVWTHGTMVAGFIASNATRGSRDLAGAGFYMGMGIAPSAGVYSTKIFNDAGAIDANHDIFTWAGQPRNAFPPILFQNHSHNQYNDLVAGAPVDGLYTTQSQQFDTAVRDANGNPADGIASTTLTVSAGNRDQAGFRNYVLGPATGKNVIAVGAAESSRDQADQVSCHNDQAESFFNVGSNSKFGTPFKTVVPEYNQIYPWSSFIKPDLVAPATLVSSTRSSDATHNFCVDPLPDGTTPWYARDSGTSFAAPAAEGAALIASRVYSQFASPTQPNVALATPALLKAMLVGAARTLEGGIDKHDGSTIPPRPSDAQGFGRIHLEDLFSSMTRQYVNQRITFQSSADLAWNGTYYVVDPSQPVKVVLSWSDAPGEAATDQNPNPGPPLVNDLDLNIDTPFHWGVPAPYGRTCWRTAYANNTSAGDWTGSIPCMASAFGVGHDFQNNTELAIFQPYNGSVIFNRFIARVTPHAINGEGTSDPTPGIQPNQDFALFVFNGRRRGDINADGRTDIVWRNTGTGEQRVWQFNGVGTNYDTGTLPLGPTVTTLSGVGDFDHNGSDDIVYEDSGNYIVIIPLNRNVQAGSFILVGQFSDANWKLRGVGDIDDDDNMDLVFRYEGGGPDQGKNVVWLMNGTAKRNELALETDANLNWTIVGTADMDSDGYVDLLWRNSVTGENRVWLMWQNPSTGLIERRSTVTLPAETDLNWAIAAASDYDSDGYSDIVWRNTSTGANRIWFMSRTSFSSSVTIGAETNQTWQIIGPR
jgi:hypothetical protein